MLKSHGLLVVWCLLIGDISVLVCKVGWFWVSGGFGLGYFCYILGLAGVMVEMSL